MAKKIAGIEEDVLLLGALGVGGYLLYTKIFGAPVSQADSNSVNNVFTTPDAQNPFSYNYQYSLYAQNPGTYGQAWWITLAQNYANLYSAGTNPSGVSGVYNYVTWGEQIRSCYGFFSIDFNTLQSIFQAVSSQADVANIASYLYFTHNISLWQLLANGTGSSFSLVGGLSTTNLAAIVNEVQALPAHN
jgi:hypothetical protein